MPSKIVRGKMAEALPTSDASMRKNNSFYGRSLPRPTLIGEPDRPVREVAKDQRGRVAFIPISQALMEWSTKAAVRMGGTHPQWSGVAPRRPQTPFRAFVAEKLLALQHSDPRVKLMPYVAQMKMLVKESTAEWKAIQETSAAKYLALSKGSERPVSHLALGKRFPITLLPGATSILECNPAMADEVRYAREIDAYEERNPGYSAWSATQSRASHWSGAPLAPPQPRQLYVRSCVAEALHEDPELADAEPKERSAALRKVRLAAVQKWRKLDAAATEPFESTVAEAVAKYKSEVEAYAAEHPGYEAWLAAATKRASAAGKSKGKRPGRGSKKVSKGGKKKTPAGGARPDTEDSDAGSEDEDAVVDGNESGLSSDDDADSKQEDSELEEMLLEASGAGRPATRKRGLAVQLPAAKKLKSGKIVEPVAKAKSGVKAQPVVKASTAKAVTTQPAARASNAKAMKLQSATKASAAQAVKAKDAPEKSTPAGKAAKAKTKPVAVNPAPVPAAKAAPEVVLAGGPPVEPSSLVGDDVLKLFYTDAAKQDVKAFMGVITEYGVIDGVGLWLVRYEDNDEEDLEWLELKPLLAQAAAAAQAAGGAKKGAASKPRAAPKRSEVSTTVLVASPRGVGPKSVTKPKKRAAATKSKAAMLKTKSVTPVRSSTRKAKRPAQAAA